MNGILMTEATTNATLSFFFEQATSALTWIITSMGTVLNFMLSNPICFIGLIVSLIVTVVGTLRHVIGG